MGIDWGKLRLLADGRDWIAHMPPELRVRRDAYIREVKRCTKVPTPARDARD